MARRTLLMVLGALLLATAWGYLPPILGLGRGSAKRAPATARAHPFGTREVHYRNQPMLDLASLDVARPHSAAGRDPWRFQDPPVRQPLTERASTPPGDESRSYTPPPPEAKPAEPTLEYLGRFGPTDKKVAVLSDGKRTFNVLEGDVIDNRFVVGHIGYESVEIRLVGFAGGPAKLLGLRRP